MHTIGAMDSPRKRKKREVSGAEHVGKVYVCMHVYYMCVCVCVCMYVYVHVYVVKHDAGVSWAGLG